MRLCLLLAICVAIAVESSPVWSQRVQGTAPPGATGTDPDSFARAVKQVDEQMTHPDPDMRIGYLEAIVAEGNARKIERAIRLAVGAADENLRAFGMRAYLATTSELPLDMVLTREESKAVEEARSNSSKRLPEYLSIAARASFKTTLVFEPAPINTIRGRVRVGTKREVWEYVMRGERMTFQGRTGIWHGFASYNCSWELRPTSDFKIKAQAACDNLGRPIPLEADMF